MLDYNVPKGKLVRGMTVFDVVRSIKGDKVTKEDARDANIVGWCIEWVFLLDSILVEVFDGRSSKGSSWWRMT